MLNNLEIGRIELWNMFFVSYTNLLLYLKVIYAKIFFLPATKPWRHYIITQKDNKHQHKELKIFLQYFKQILFGT